MIEIKQNKINYLPIAVGTLACSLSRIKDCGIQIIFPNVTISLVTPTEIYQWHLASFSTICLYTYSSLYNSHAFTSEYKPVPQTKSSVSIFAFMQCLSRQRTISQFKQFSPSKPIIQLFPQKKLRRSNVFIPLHRAKCGWKPGCQIPAQLSASDAYSTLLLLCYML